MPDVPNRGILYPIDRGDGDRNGIPGQPGAGHDFLDDEKIGQRLWFGVDILSLIRMLTAAEKKLVSK
jgi:hypothetical protein